MPTARGGSEKLNTKKLRKNKIKKLVIVLPLCFLAVNVQYVLMCNIW